MVDFSQLGTKNKYPLGNIIIQAIYAKIFQKRSLAWNFWDNSVQLCILMMPKAKNPYSQKKSIQGNTYPQTQ